MLFVDRPYTCCKRLNHSVLLSINIQDITRLKVRNTCSNIYESMHLLHPTLTPDKTYFISFHYISPRIVFSNRPDLDQIIPDEYIFDPPDCRPDSPTIFHVLPRLSPDQYTMAGELITDVPRAIDKFPGRRYTKVHASTRRYTAKAR